MAILLKKAITDIKLSESNVEKLGMLNELSVEYMHVCQVYCNLLSEKDSTPNKYGNLPEIETKLSVRWQRVAWQQACGIIKSWKSNKRENKPVLKQIAIQANINVAMLEKNENSISFDYWIKLSTLEKGQPILLPIKIYKHASETIEKYPKLFNGVLFQKRDEDWFVTLVVGKDNKKKKELIEQIIGIDLGMKSFIVTSNDKSYGDISQKIRKKVEKSKEKRTRKQKLNACLKKKGQPTVSLVDGKTERFVRNEVGNALNQTILNLPENAAVAFERLSVRNMNLKSKDMNRWLKVSQLGFLRDRLKFKLDHAGIVYRSVQAAYSSQECSSCGFVDKGNRKTQSEFCCLSCGFTLNADVNAALNLAKRFGDDELNCASIKNVKIILNERFNAKCLLQLKNRQISLPILV